MTRVERDREDLLAEATALTERIELELPAAGHVCVEEVGNVFREPCRVIVGFRASGCGGVYFGPDEAYQFNTAGELRRAYRGGDLYKAERGRLVRLRRRRTHEEVQLIRHELEADESADLLGRMGELLNGLRTALAEKSCSIIGQVPAEADLIGRVAAWLATLPRGAVARSPHAR